jgi:hypothetical protein
MLRDGLILALLPLAVIAFSLWEWGGLTDDPWHTISFYAQHHLWLAVVIFFLPWIAAGIFDAWWWYHMHSVIPRL